ncbi:MAG: Crp/Fnr family transcriptional regulator [Armatimonadetes bacterium]|nr:Crp/Fnr family transcriptional regulator [Armatimonadota bacterium]
MSRPGPGIESLGVPRGYPAGALLFQAGSPAAEFFYVTSGGVRVYKVDEQGRELEVARFGPGDFLGEAVAFAGGRYPFNAQAVAQTHALSYSAANVLRAIDTHPEAARFFIELLARKCLLLGGRLESLGLRTVRQRLARYLCANCAGGQVCVVTLAVKKGELARLLGTASETLSRTFRQLRTDGLIEVRGPRIRIKDCARLRAEAGE